RNFTLLSTFSETDVQVVETSPGLWDVAFSWDAQVPAGRMGNASGREWVTLFVGMPLPWDLVFGQYRNASSPTPIGAQAFFSLATGDLDLMGFNGPPGPVPADPTGEFQVGFMVYTLDDFNNMIGQTLVYGSWFSIVNLTFIRDDLVPSGTHGLWLQAWDYGDNYGQNWTFLDVDNAPPSADAGPDQPVSSGTLATFDGSASSDNVGITNYTWTFQDGGSVTLYEVAPTYTFTEPGVYVVTLTVKDAADNTDTDTVTITVLDVTSPTADAGPDQTVDEDTVVTFDGSASSDNVGVTNYTWDFDDGILGYGAAPTHTFAEPGEYTVTLTVTDAAGNVGTDTLTVTVEGVGIEISNVVLYGIIGTVIAIALIIGILVWRRSR
ncbi:MAG: PKD domain-containing protein, partial [Thermoplasmata archaeon]